MTPRRIIRSIGTTLAEVLVSAVFTAAIASAVLASATQTSRRITSTERRNAALCELQAQLAETRTAAETTALNPGNTNSSIVLPATPESVAISKTIAAVPGYAKLYTVKVTASWPEGDQSAYLTLDTMMRAPND